MCFSIFFHSQFLGRQQGVLPKLYMAVRNIAREINALTARILVEGGIGLTSFYEGALIRTLGLAKCVANGLLYRIIMFGYTSVLYTSTLFNTDLYYTYTQTCHIFGMAIRIFDLNLCKNPYH